MAPFDPTSREAEAQAEIAATRLGRGVAPATTAGFLLLLALHPLVEWNAWRQGRSEILTPLPPPRVEGSLGAARAAIAEIESRYDERSALAGAVRPRAQAGLARSLGYGNERVWLGRDDWLFLRDDVDHLISRRLAEGFAGDPRSTILAFRDELAARGVALVLAPTPLKPTVHPDRLAADAAPPVRRAGEIEALAALAGEGVVVVDLADRFARDAVLAPLYLAHDTHWRPEAMEVAAIELAFALRATVALSPGDPALREAAPSRRRGAGDLEAMLDLPSGGDLFVPEEVVARPPAAPTAPAAGAGAEVVLLGDSFAGIYGAADLGWGAGAGLADRLAAQLGLPVDRLLRNAGGATATRRAFAEAWRRAPERFARLRVVVWQFAARELSQGAWEPVTLP